MQRVTVIALNTFRESVRSKVLYAVLFFAVAMVVVSAMFGAVTLGDQIKVIKDFGLFSLCFFAVAYSVIAGASLLFKELSKKTVYNILAKPVKRWEFLCGKYLGMVATVFLLLVLMGGGLSLFAYWFEQRLDTILLQAYLFIFLQLLIVCAYTIFFSSLVVTPMLAGAFSFGIFLAGRSTEYLLYFIQNGNLSGAAAKAMQLAYLVLPHLDALDISNRAVYGGSASLAFTLWAALYAVSYAGVLLVLANFIFRKREFN